MKIMLVNGSPKENGCTAAALKIIAENLTRGGASVEILHLGASPMPDCIACTKCRRTGMCIYADEVNIFAEKARDADGFVFASPVYYAHPSGRLLSFMDRLFFSASRFLCHKPAAAVFTLRRAGAASALDTVNKHFLMAEMPVVASTYWNHAFRAGDGIEKDLEGVKTLENLAENMLWLIRAIKCAEGAGILPPECKSTKTGFLEG